MNNMLRHIMGALFVLMLLTTAAVAQQIDLTPYFQAEVNEVSVLRAQMNYLQQQGDPLGAAVIASYIPNHQVQASSLSAVIVQQGGNVSAIQPNVTPTLGTRQQIFQQQLQAQSQLNNSYQQLEGQSNNNVYDQLALRGQNGATRNYQSLQVANGSTDWTQTSLIDATTAALALELGMIADLQTQANSLTALGDQATANMLLAMVPQHQQQATDLQTSLVTLGGDPTKAVAAPVVALADRSTILTHFKIFDAQMVNTYAIAASTLPPSPLRETMVAGGMLSLNQLASLQQLPIA